MMQLFWNIRKKIKKFICRYTSITECCQKCGVRQYIVWWSDNDLWKFLTLEEVSGIYCPCCFSKLAEARGLLLTWKPEIEINFHEKYEVLRKSYE